MRIALVVLALLAPCLLAAQPAAPAPSTPPVRLEVTFSKPLAVFHYIRQLAPRARANPYKTQFAASAYATPANLAMLDAFGAVRTDYEYRYDGYPDGKIEGNTLYVLKRNLALASSLADFRARSIVVIPSADLATLVATLEAFTPIYDSLVYAPSRSTFERQLGEIRTILAARQGAAHFDRIRMFFRASWDPSIPFIFAFYPRPAGGGFTATAFGNISESELPADMTNYSTMLSLMLHEAAHILMDEQRLDAAREMQQWFAESPALTATYAKGLMQESWATAVGNGFFGEQLTGSLSSGSWYGQRHISDLGKQVLPLIRPYLEAGRPLDRSLVDAYIGVFDRNFRHWLSEWEFLMIGRAVLSERPADFTAVERRFPYRSAQHYERDFSESSLRALRASGLSMLVVISRDHAATLERLRAAFPELADWRPDLSADLTHATMTAEKRRLIVVNLVSGTLEDRFNSPLPPLTPF